MEPSTVLFLAANPAQLHALELGEECRAIESKIRQSKFGGQIRFRPRWAARPDDLIQALNEDAPSVLHFSGHGAGDQGLCFQSEDGSALHVSADSLVQVMKTAGTSVAIVVLNACFSESQAQALAAHVPCVVGMSGAIGDRRAMVYAGTFYRALASGRSVANAHDQGIAALGLPYVDGKSRDVEQVASPPSQFAPRLLTRADTDADCVYLAGAPPTTRRCLLVIKATLRDFDSDVLARVTDELRRLTGDLSVQITDVEEGSVRLTISLSPAGAQTLAKLKAAGQLAKLGGFEVSDVIELAAAAVANRAAIVGERVLQRAAQGGARSGQAGRGHSDGREDLDHYKDDRDGDILALVARGSSKEAILLLMRQYGASVYRFCQAVLQDASLADNILQQVFIQAFRDLPAFTGRASLHTWLLAIACRRVLDAQKKRSRERRWLGVKDDPTAIDGNAESPSADPDGDTRADAALREALQLLDPDVQVALVLRYQHGFTFEEIGSILDELPGTLYARVAQALPRLRAHIEKLIGRTATDL